MFMKRIATYAMIATMATATALTLPAPQAEAKDGRNGAFVAGAITGLVTGAIAGQALKDNDNGRNHFRGPRRHFNHHSRHYGRPKPWTNAWYDYCHSRYRSFNPRTGYFLGYDGDHHFCR